MSKPYIKKISDNSILRCNCVLWARTKSPTLPFGLWTFEQKKAVINTTTPAIGAVAIIQTQQKWGHVAIVTKIGKRHITIQEANFVMCQITERHGPPASLRIAGYYIKKGT